MREGPRFLRRAVDVRADHLRPRSGRGRSHPRGIRARLLPSRAGSVPGDHGDEAVARHPQEPQAAQAPRAVSGREHQALLQARHRAPGSAIRSEARLLTPRDPDTTVGDAAVGEVYLSAAQIATRVAELGEEITGDYAGRE